MVDKSTVAKAGTVQAPDLEIAGEIRQRTNISGDRSRQRLEYEFDFRAVDANTGQIAFSMLIDIKKLGSNKNFAW
jgi:PBP1b-binding outer membrane lipoprotein LpoB